EQDELRMIFAAAPSQNEMLEYLAQSDQINWSRITAFHMDEYIGLPVDAPQRFANFLKEKLFDRVTLRAVHLIEGNDNPTQECQRYADLLVEKPIDIVCLGIGENGHIAFNDPPVADFEDPQMVKVVDLDARCRQQQVNDGCFASLDTVPTQAITLTIPMLMSGKYLYCVVPGSTKREAVDNTLNGPISTDCPASILRTHQDCQLYLDTESARTEQQEGFLES
ncbi:MAG: glucosamine-6-phosphate deaminase, partial [Bacteroidota bacterium]